MSKISSNQTVTHPALLVLPIVKWLLDCSHCEECFRDVSLSNCYILFWMFMKATHNVLKWRSLFVVYTNVNGFSTQKKHCYWGNVVSFSVYEYCEKKFTTVISHPSIFLRGIKCSFRNCASLLNNVIVDLLIFFQNDSVLTGAINKWDFLWGKWVLTYCVKRKKSVFFL